MDLDFVSYTLERVRSSFPESRDEQDRGYLLSKVDVSYAYPLMMGVGYSMIVLFSWQIFGEPFSSFKWTGIALILAGVFLLGK